MAYELTEGQKKFVRRVAAKTGLNSKVIAAQVFTEMNGGAAQARERAGNHNWLNIAYYDSGPGSITKSKVWSDPIRAADATADFFKGKRFGPSQGIRNIIKTAGESPEAQIAAIAKSGWATNPAYGSTIRAVWQHIKAPGSDGSSKSSGGSAPSARPGPSQMRTETQTAFDSEAFQTAQRRSMLGQLIARRNPNSSLLRFGLLNTAEPARSDFITTTQVQVPQERTNATQHPSQAPSGDIRAGHTPGIGGTLNELFYNGPGGVNVKNGGRVGTGFVSGHTDHVHVAAGPRSIQRLAKIAQQMGLTVRELAPFDQVDPVHVQGSYHYRKRAADISGDPKKMAAYSRRVAKIYGIKS